MSQRGFLYRCPPCMSKVLWIRSQIRITDEQRFMSVIHSDIPSQQGSVPCFLMILYIPRVKVISSCGQTKRGISPAQSVNLNNIPCLACDSFRFYSRLLISRDVYEQAAMFGRASRRDESSEVLPCMFQLSACIPKHQRGRAAVL